MSGKKEIESHGSHKVDIKITEFKSIQLLSIIDLLRKGMQLNLVIGIDFTGSNGLATTPGTLHYMDKAPNRPLNGYEGALTSVGGILQEYDTKKMFPVFGFGANYVKAGIPQVSHCFPLTGKPAEPYVNGIDGVLGVYRHCLPDLIFAGPTNFAPLINECMRVVSLGVQAGVFGYSVLLILTDGAISDLELTI